MRIKKVNAASAALQTDTVNADTSTSADYSEAIGYIHSAISALSTAAKNDPLAKESIANLSVILFDLKG